MAQRITKAFLKRKADLIASMTGKEFDIEAGSNLYGHAWKLTDARRSHTWLSAGSARELGNMIDAMRYGIEMVQARA